MFKNNISKGIAIILAPFALLLLNAFVQFMVKLQTDSLSENSTNTIIGLVNATSVLLGFIGVTAIIPCLIFGIITLTKK